MQNTGQLYGSDDESYFAHATALVFFQFPSDEKELYQSMGKIPRHSIGPAIMALPFTFVFSQIDRLMGSTIIKKRNRKNIKESWTLFGFVLSTYFYFWMACVLLFLGLRYFYDEFTCFLTVVFMVLIQGVPLYMFRRPVFSHMYEFFLQSALLYILIKDFKTKFLDNDSAMLILIGIFIGLISLVRYNNIAI